jgi:Cu/Ag efflux protein CusF
VNPDGHPHGTDASLAESLNPSTAMKANIMKHIHKLTLLTFALAAVPWGAASGQTGTIPASKDPHAGHHAAEQKNGESAAYADAEVRKVDKEAGKITLKHGPIPSLDMPAMSMVFRAKDPAMLDQLNAGDRIRFKAEKVQGAYTVTEIERGK